MRVCPVYTSLCAWGPPPFMKVTPPHPNPMSQRAQSPNFTFPPSPLPPLHAMGKVKPISSGRTNLPLSPSYPSYLATGAGFRISKAAQPIEPTLCRLFGIYTVYERFYSRSRA